MTHSENSIGQAAENGAEPSEGTSRVLEAALKYAGQGLFVLPIRPGDKRPLTAHGFKDASRDPAILRAWWEKNPDANIGIATGEGSGVVVLDVDDLKGGRAALTKLVGEHGPLALTPLCLTGGGGRHFYFRAPAAPLRCSA